MSHSRVYDFHGHIRALIVLLKALFSFILQMQRKQNNNKKDVLSMAASNGRKILQANGGVEQKMDLV